MTALLLLGCAPDEVGGCSGDALAEARRVGREVTTETFPDEEYGVLEVFRNNGDAEAWFGAPLETVDVTEHHVVGLRTAWGVGCDVGHHLTGFAWAEGEGSHLVAQVEYACGDPCETGTLTEVWVTPVEELHACWTGEECG